MVVKHNICTSSLPISTGTAYIKKEKEKSKKVRFIYKIYNFIYKNNFKILLQFYYQIILLDNDYVFSTFQIRDVTLPTIFAWVL